MTEVLHKGGVDAQHSLCLHDIAYCEGADIAAVLEIAGVERLFSHLEKDFAAIGPLRKNVGRSGCDSAFDVFVLVVLLGSSNDAVLGDVGNHLSDFTLRQRDINPETHAVVRLVLLAGVERKRRDKKYAGK